MAIPFRVLISIFAAAGCVIFLGCKPVVNESKLVFTASEEAKQLPPDAQVKISQVLEATFGTPPQPKAPENSGLNGSLLRAGFEFYQRNCNHCHGTSGDGAGPTGPFLFPEPRDFRKGIFKFTSTKEGPEVKPSRDDLYRIITNGVNYTAMPSFVLYSEGERRAVAEYVMFLTMRGVYEDQLVVYYNEEEDFEFLEDEEVMEEEIGEKAFGTWKEAQGEDFIVKPAAPRPAYTKESIARGRELFLAGSETDKEKTDGASCWSCHAVDGTGKTGTLLPMDSWGNRQMAADLTQGIYRGGGRPIDLYRRIYAGIKGAAMPGFELDPDPVKNSEKIWDIVHFVYSLAERPEGGE